MADKAPHLLELKLRDVNQLFNSMDPSPFLDKDLDDDADEFIVSWAREFPVDDPFTLRVHLEQWPASDPSPLIRDAIHHHFANRAKLGELEFRRLMKQGRLTLIIGVLFLGVCLTAARMLAREPGAFTGYLRESLTIAGWVAMWRPMETYLYDWWPVRRKIRVLRRLSEMAVEVVPRAA